MILPKSSDLLITGFSPQAKLRVAFAEVTDSARLLEQNHLCGPTAGMALAEALAAVALLGADLSGPDETVMMRAMVSGPLQGVLVEAAADGGLRGYTTVKVLDALDGLEELDLETAFGENGRVNIIRSAPGKIISQALLDISPFSPRLALEEYFNRSLQRDVMVQTAAFSYGGYIDRARGVLVERLPDSPGGPFGDVVRLNSDGTALETLETCLSAREWCAAMGLPDVRFDEPRALAFRCRCSMAKVEAVLAAFPARELQEQMAAQEPAQVFCHMCGKGYQISRERLARLVAAKEMGEKHER